MSKQFGYGIGYELEAYQMNLLKVRALIKDSEFHPKKAGRTLDYRKYNILDERDITVNNDSLCGGEVVSPIIYDEESLLNSICYVLDVLKEAKACNLDYTKSYAGLHFHFGLETLNRDYQQYSKIIKFMHAFSGEIYDHSHSPSEELRAGVYEYARPYQKYTLDYILKKYHHFKNMRDDTLEVNSNNPFIIFSSKSYMYRFTSDTIEFRTCNSPLIGGGTDTFDKEKSFEQFREYFTFFQKVIEYMNSPDFDMDLIDYYYEIDRSNLYLPIKTRSEEIKRILKLEK